MAIFLLRDVAILLDGMNISGFSNSADLEMNAATIDTTVWGSPARQFVPGLREVKASIEGFWDGADNGLDEKLNLMIGGANKNFSMIPLGLTPGNVMFSFQAALSQYSMKGAPGDAFEFSIQAEGSGDLIKQTLMEYGAKVASGNGTARNLGQVSTNQTLYGFMQVLAVSGTNPTLDVIVESDNAEGMTTPITRLTFDQATGVGAQKKTFTGLVGDDWWRIKWTLGGTDTPSFLIAVGVGIQ